MLPQGSLLMRGWHTPRSILQSGGSCFLARCMCPAGQAGAGCWPSWGHSCLLGTAECRDNQHTCQPGGLLLALFNRICCLDLPHSQLPVAKSLYPPSTRNAYGILVVACSPHSRVAHCTPHKIYMHLPKKTSPWGMLSASKLRVLQNWA